MEGRLKEPESFLVREEPIRRLSQLVYAAYEACRRTGDVQLNMAALPNAIGARCALCGFVLSGEELLALAEISSANEKSTMLQRLREGRCAREGCSSSHYSLSFYQHPQLKWAALLSKSRPKEKPKPELQRAEKRRSKPQIVGSKSLRFVAALGFCFGVWFWWQWHSGGRIPYLREPEHFHVTHGPDPAHH